jgi:hypothetical protein
VLNFREGERKLTIATRVCIITPGPLSSDPRVVKEAQALTEAGLEVTVISTRTLNFLDDLDQDILVQALWRTQRLDFRSRWKRSFRRATQIALARSFAATGWGPLADRGLNPFTFGLIAAAKRVETDLYIAHYPAALPAAGIAARTHNAIYAFDAEDFHLGAWPDLSGHDSEQTMIRAIEKLRNGICQTALISLPPRQVLPMLTLIPMGSHDPRFF